MGAVLMLSLCATMAMMAAQGRAREAIPLHLCGLSALAAAAVAFGVRGFALDFLWYIGLPGALLALVFPTPAISRWQTALNLSYAATHALIVLIPLSVMARGARPERNGAPLTLIALQFAGLAAFFVNRALGTDFMFLCAPPAGTPLEDVFAWGYLPYLCALEGLMLACCLLMGALLGAGERTRAALKLRSIAPGKKHGARIPTAECTRASDPADKSPCEIPPDAL